MKTSSFILVFLLLSTVSESEAQIMRINGGRRMMQSQPDTSAAASFGGPEYQNYVLEYTSRDGGLEYGLKSYSYYDGFGNPVQKVQVGASPSGYDIADYREYDSWGREWRTWLPSEHAGLPSGLPVPSAKAKAAAVNQYSDHAPYSYPEYEHSTLGRVVARNGPGQSWLSAGKKTTIAYMTNTAIEGDSLACPNIRVRQTESANFILIDNGLYKAGTMSVRRICNESDNVSFEFRDPYGRLVLSRKVGDGGLMYDTYYVHDGMDRIVAVIPPLAFSSSNEISGISLAEMGYQYFYNGRGQLTAKVLPGCAPEHFAYDNADRLILRQDGNLAAKGQCEFRIYDVFGRECLRGRCTNNISDGSWCQGNVLCRYTGNVSAGFSGYEIEGIELSSPSLDNINYYDSYDFLGFSGFSRLDYTPIPEMTDAVNQTPTGQLTGKVVSVYAIDSVQSLFKSLYYDMRSRLVQTAKTNHLGGTDIESVRYNYDGQPASRLISHTASFGRPVKELYRYSYDQAGRVLSVSHSINDRPAIMLHGKSYDAAGRLSGDSRNGVSGETYSYNVRSWMTKLSSNNFSLRLFYDNPYYADCPSYNGNISGIEWSVGGLTRAYSFGYDGLSRLTSANYYENMERNINYDTSYRYDAAGNVISFTRNSSASRRDDKRMDDVVCVYDNSRLVESYDNVADVYKNGIFGFTDRFDTKGFDEDDYAYDANGNMTKDSNKEITGISYNHIDRQENIKYESSNEITFSYSSDGEKLRAEYVLPFIRAYPIYYDTLFIGKIDSSYLGIRHVENEYYSNKDFPFDFKVDFRKLHTTLIDYCDNKIYTNGKLTEILIDGGRIVFDTDGNPDYQFYTSDHQGNVRIVSDMSGNIVQTNHYYPYGGLFVESSELFGQRYRYNGKELDRMGGLDLYDYGSRKYDAALIRWTARDPAAEEYYSTSMYAYCAGNPMAFNDEQGKYITYYNHANGRLYLYSNGNFYHFREKKGNGRRVVETVGKAVKIPRRSYNFMYRALLALRFLDNSKNKTISKVFDALKKLDSRYEHRIYNGYAYNVESFMHPSKGIMSEIYVNLYLSKKGEDFKGIGLTYNEVIGHELKHSYDEEFGISNKGIDNGKDITEFSTVNFENLIRKEEGRKIRTRYGIKIPDKYKDWFNLK